MLIVLGFVLKSTKRNILNLQKIKKSHIKYMSIKVWHGNPHNSMVYKFLVITTTTLSETW